MEDNYTTSHYVFPEWLDTQIREHEGRVSKIYKDSEGISTIGIGRNLEGKGLSNDEIELMFSNDKRDALNEAKGLFANFDTLDAVRQGVLIEMCFQMGRGGVSEFVNMRKAIGNGDFIDAASEMLNSKWAKQTPARAKEMANMMHSGNHIDFIV